MALVASAFNMITYTCSHVRVYRVRPIRKVIFGCSLNSLFFIGEIWPESVLLNFKKCDFGDIQPPEAKFLLLENFHQILT
jgi:hypothetical protein